MIPFRGIDKSTDRKHISDCQGMEGEGKDGLLNGYRVSFGKGMQMVWG